VLTRNYARLPIKPLGHGLQTMLAQERSRRFHGRRRTSAKTNFCARAGGHRRSIVEQRLVPATDPLAQTPKAVPYVTAVPEDVAASAPPAELRELAGAVR